MLPFNIYLDIPGAVATSMSACFASLRDDR